MPQITTGGASRNGNRFVNQTRSVEELPDECPICHKKIVPDLFCPAFETFGQRLEVFCRCSNSKCLRSFISLYTLDAGLSRAGTAHYRFVRSFPIEPTGKAVAATIAELSPSFVGIWAQAQLAEDYGLDEIAGPGFRKALEFLLKDYAISQVTDDQDKSRIRAIPLQSVIKNYLSGDRLPVVSSRAAWLGNDETHYEKRWVGKNLQDLKKLIEATEYFIAMTQLSEALSVEMPDPKDGSI